MIVFESRKFKLMPKSPRLCLRTAQRIALTRGFFPEGQSLFQGRKEKVWPKPFFKLPLSTHTQALKLGVKNQLRNRLFGFEIPHPKSTACVKTENK